MGKKLAIVGIIINVPFLMLGFVLGAVAFNPLMALAQQDQQLFIVQLMVVSSLLVIISLLLIVACIIHYVRADRLKKVNVT